ncbi:hypothetical protein E2C01_059542 [Portunus trituberculatus]|uniref:Secreted protein n=1 Tax=Portunus trituberculatus TaxID=210409 RepID=A0A5B7H8P1_PORTR|nr:hypothetical protein [Portunus trituberculatus]
MHFSTTLESVFTWLVISTLSGHEIQGEAKLNISLVVAHDTSTPLSAFHPRLHSIIVVRQHISYYFSYHLTYTTVLINIRNSFNELPAKLSQGLPLGHHKGRTDGCYSLIHADRRGRLQHVHPSRTNNQVCSSSTPSSRPDPPSLAATNTLHN